jgi:5-methylcytosine-specific restriction endonuclease McrA
LSTEVISIIRHGERIINISKGIIQQALHEDQLISKICQDNRWTKETFNRVDWETYKRALQEFPRSHRISLIKLTHKLWNTNLQDMWYYGESGLCPICNVDTEMIDHIFQCQAPYAVDIRTKAYKLFQENMAKSIPKEMLTTILVKLQETTYTALELPGVTQKVGNSETLEAASTAQGEIGWISFFRGHISRCWYEVLLAAKNAKTRHQQRTSGKGSQKGYKGTDQTNQESN